MLTSALQLTQLLIASPLDQFGADSDLLGSLDNVLTDNLPAAGLVEETLSLLGVAEMDNLADCVAVLLSSGLTLIFDDEDSSDSVWEDAGSLVSGLQSSIFSANLVGMVPGLETITSEASFAFLLSISVMTSVVVVGLSLHTVRFFSILYPTGTPSLMAPFIILIEAISYSARAVSLGMRLFANMFAGHSLVKILMSFAWLFVTSAAPFFAVPVFAMLLLIVMLECGIAYLQSYVFATLSGLYIEDVVGLEH